MATRILDNVNEKEMSFDKNKTIAQGYKIKHRGLDEIKRHGANSYLRIVNEMGGFDEENIKLPAYEGAEHKPEDLSTKLPNLTLLKNLRLGWGDGEYFMFGQTMGHSHPANGPATQEIYEFFGYGAMLIASRDDSEKSWTKLYVAKPGDKVVVPGNCMMTLFSLNLFYRHDSFLLTADMANPDENESDKEVQKEKGTMMVMFTPDGSYGPEVVLNSSYKHFGIDEDVSLHIRANPARGEKIVKSLVDKKDIFSGYNIELIEAEPVVSCIDRKGKEHRLENSLEELVHDKSKPIHRILGMI